MVGHSVRRLSQRVAEYDARFLPRVDDWGMLDANYIATRYPSGLPDDIPARVFNRQAAESALALAEAALAEVEAWFAGQPGDGPERADS